MAEPNGNSMAAATETEKKQKKLNTNFFKVGFGSSTSRPALVDEEESKDEVWRNIKPNQNVDALNKEVFKKRKYEEFRQRQERMQGRKKNNKSNQYQS